MVNNHRPFNAEPRPELLLDAGFITPNELYYVRNHLPVPMVDPRAYRLRVEIDGQRGSCVSYSLQDLKTKFPHVSYGWAVSIDTLLPIKINHSTPRMDLLPFFSYTGTGRVESLRCILGWEVILPFMDR